MTPDSQFVRLLSFLSEADSPFSSDENTPLSDIRAMAELSAGGFISAGEIVRDEVGRICCISCAEITLSGRAHLAALRRAAEIHTAALPSQKEGLINSDEKWWKKSVGIIFLAVVGGLLLALLKFLFGL